jgi:hypothetical protein
VLLDANIVIESHKLGIWDQLKVSYKLTLPAIVRRGEVLYCFIDGRKVAINLENQVVNKEIDELEATAQEVGALFRIFESWFLETLDPGETEALALLETRNLSEFVFCTSDAPAIKALVMLGKSSSGVSLETLLAKIGLTKNLQKQFSEPFFEGCCKQGSVNLITRTGLRNSI